MFDPCSSKRRSLNFPSWSAGKGNEKAKVTFFFGIAGIGMVSLLVDKGYAESVLLTFDHVARRDNTKHALCLLSYYPSEPYKGGIFGPRH